MKVGSAIGETGSGPRAALSRAPTTTRATNPNASTPTRAPISTPAPALRLGGRQFGGV
ncbi:hypothetical protein N5079_24340 [Planotetraspora sp. A-T 1434]|uniref:hypothetical protein n=1 Tax=Planotetraspora sp. A-T 1434 TaxID=2979219 RepID=UPI0021C062E2|nr:hypothetical protein [Planotetraspora sp. A-T 1434]MCT9933347.1 hypothetical protein [Planotetraspora sp. A-T 1434]